MNKKGTGTNENIVYFNNMEDEGCEYTKEELEELYYKLDEKNITNYFKWMIYRRKELLINEIMKITEIEILDRLYYWACYILDKKVIHEDDLEKMEFVPIED